MITLNEFISTLSHEAAHNGSGDQTTAPKPIAADMNSTVGNWEWDVESENLQLSEGTCRIFEIRIIENISAKLLLPLVSIHDRRRLMVAIRNTISEKKSLDLEFQIITANGKIKWVHLLGECICKKNSRVLAGIKGVIRVIPEIDRGDTNKLIRERHLLRALIDHLPDFIYVKDREFRHLVNNKANLDLIGAASEEETIGKTVLDYFGVGTAQKYIDRDREVMETGQAIFNLEEKILTPEGRVKWLLTTKVPLRNEKDEIIGLVGISRDITEHKQLEAELANQKIRRQQQITETTILDREKEKERIGRELHDNINQVLTTIKMYMDMAIGEKDVRNDLLQKSHDYLAYVIDEINLISKSLVPPSLGDIGLKEALNELINSATVSGGFNISLVTKGLYKSVMNHHIELMAYRIVEEQLTNVIKHAKASEVKVSLIISQKILKIEIQDNGIGFKVGSKTKGIGLSNIVSRAELHGGKVDICSSDGNGCTLIIEIPL